MAPVVPAPHTMKLGSTTKALAECVPECDRITWTWKYQRSACQTRTESPGAPFMVPDNVRSQSQMSQAWESDTAPPSSRWWWLQALLLPGGSAGSRPAASGKPGGAPQMVPGYLQPSQNPNGGSNSNQAFPNGGLNFQVGSTAMDMSEILKHYETRTVAQGLLQEHQEHPDSNLTSSYDVIGCWSLWRVA